MYSAPHKAQAGNVYNSIEYKALMKLEYHMTYVWICFCFQVVHLPGVGCTQEAFQVHIIRPPMHTIGIVTGTFQYQVVTE